MSNMSKPPVSKVVPYCQDPMSSCGLFAWGENTGKAPAGTIFKPMFFSGKTSGASQFGSMGYRNATGDDSGKDDTSGDGGNWSDKIDADTITAGLETAQGVLSLFGKKELSEVENACGKQPKGILRGKAVKQAWAKCASDYVQSKIEANKPKREQGLSTGAWAVIGVSSAIFLVGGFYFISKNMSKNKSQQIVMTRVPIK